MQAGATFMQCEKGARVLNPQLVSVSLGLHDPVSPQARTTQNGHEEPAWLGV